MIIAVTANDETNLAVTLIAEQLFNVPSRIARVRNDELREYPALLSTSGFRATSVIWPEEAITNYIVQLITYPEALQVIEFSDGDVVLMSVKIVSSSKMCGRPVSALQDELPRVKVQIVSIYRQKYRLDDIDGKTVLEAGDEIFFLTTKACAHAVVKTFRVKTRRSDRVMIVGGGVWDCSSQKLWIRSKRFRETPITSRSLSPTFPAASSYLRIFPAPFSYCTEI